MEGKKSKQLIFAIAVLSVFYAVGIIGLLNNATVSLFQALVPYNILLSVGILLFFHRNWTLKSAGCMLAIVLSGFLLEAVGVNTGSVFGEYYYGEALGWKLFHTPLIIGVNWLMLVYITHFTVRQIGIGRPWIELTAAALMTALDYLIEPVAVAYDFWYWQDGIIPLQNFVAWFYISFAMQMFFNKLKPAAENVIAIPLFILQIVFFTALNIW